MISKQEATELFERIRSGFTNLERDIAEAIRLRAWEPLGYASFVDAWDDLLRGVPLATDGMKVHVIYAMIDAGRTDGDIAARLDGRVGTRSIANVREQKDRGIPAGPLVRVRSFDRALPSQPDTLHVTLGAERLARYKELCEVRGLDYRVQAARDLYAGMLKLERASVATG